jgi:hypothetical protein
VQDTADNFIPTETFSSILLNVRSSSSMPTFVCDLCKKKVYSKRELEKHYETHNPKKVIRDGQQKDSGGYYAGDAQQEAYAGSAITNSYGSTTSYGSF